MIVSSFSIDNHDASVRQFTAEPIIAFLVIFQYANIVLVQGVFHAFYIFKFGRDKRVVNEQIKAPWKEIVPVDARTVHMDTLRAAVEHAAEFHHNRLVHVVSVTP